MLLPIPFILFLTETYAMSATHRFFLGVLLGIILSACTDQTPTDKALLGVWEQQTEAQVTYYLHFAPGQELRMYILHEGEPCYNFIMAMPFRMAQPGQLRFETNGVEAVMFYEISGGMLQMRFDEKTQEVMGHAGFMTDAYRFVGTELGGCVNDPRQPPGERRFTNLQIRARI